MSKADEQYLQSLVAERERILALKAQWEAGKLKLTMLNKLIAMYGNDADEATVSHVTDLATKRTGKVSRSTPLACTEDGCTEGPFMGNQGLALHLKHKHGGKQLPASAITPGARGNRVTRANRKTAS